jgi:glycosyltransferase involved in cell wall biosynthesis
MKVALVHELLTMRGGAEKLTKVVAELFPDAPIYTLLYNQKKLGDWFPRNRVRFSRLQKFAFLSTNHHLYLRMFPKAIESWDFSGYDLVISFSSAFAHGIKTSKKTKHLCYVNSPARYLWDRTFDVQSRMNPVERCYADRTFHTLRQWDAEAAERGDKLLAASKEVQRRIELYWRRESDVLYPPVDVNSFPLNEKNRKNYYVIASTLVPYKRIDIAIASCSRHGKHLKVIGDGPARKSLEKMAGKSVEFLGYVSEDQLREELRNARAFILPGEEDFAIAPIEAMACGTPVIAYGKGGALETIQDGVTGVFFPESDSESLSDAIERFKGMRFDPHACRKRAQEFSQERFEERIRNAIDLLMNEQP